VQPPTPKWEGLQGFNTIWRDTCIAASAPGLGEDGLLLTAKTFTARFAAAKLDDCRPISFGKAQLEAVQGITAADGVDAWEFYRDSHLPFEPLFLDFCALGADPSKLQVSSSLIELYGALFCEDATPFRQTLFIPFGLCEERDRRPVKQQDQINPSYSELAGPVGQLTVHVNQPLLDPASVAVVRGAGGYAACSLIPVRQIAQLCHDWLRDDSPVSLDGISHLLASAPPDWALIIGAQPEISAALDNGQHSAEEWRIPLEDAFPPHEAEENINSLLITGLTILHQFQAAVDALYFLDSRNVTIEDAEVSRQVRRQIERSDGEIQIAQTVRVGPTKVRRNGSTQGRGGAANYSHRFERRGYSRHVTKGSHAKVDLVRPCFRRDEEGELTCPSGCRREWVPPTIIGDQDLPFVPKSRIVPGPTVDDERA